MILKIEKQIKKNAKVQTEVPKELLEHFFNQGLELWYFIEEYTEIDTDDEDWDDGVWNDEDFCGFPMSCISLDLGDETSDILDWKTYYADKKLFKITMRNLPSSLKDSL